MSGRQHIPTTNNHQPPPTTPPNPPGLILSPLPVGAWAFIGLTTVVATGTLPFATAVSAMTSEVIWLIVISFFFAKAFETTGLGERIANVFVAAMGKSTLGLGYGLMVAGEGAVDSVG